MPKFDGPGWILGGFNAAEKRGLGKGWAADWSLDRLGTAAKLAVLQQWGKEGIEEIKAMNHGWLRHGGRDTRESGGRRWIRMATV
jgi:hypothetical protein